MLTEKACFFGRMGLWHQITRIPSKPQHLLGRARWDDAEVCKDLGAYVVEHRGDPQAVLVLDETGFLKKGHHSAGGARQ